VEAGKALCALISLVVAVALIYLGLNYIEAFTPSSLQPPQLSAIEWFATYRAFDLAFLALTVFAATVGAAALFRYEGERPGPEEESVVEGEVEEMGEEE